ncbi:MAG TPA: ABC transporter permease [Planctomycetes bacterium]|nr:ABC transporter permease [Planctomycetota bacterium]
MLSPLKAVEKVGRSFHFFCRTATSVAVAPKKEWRFRIPLLIEQILRAGLMSTPIVLLFAGLVGIILVLQTAFQLAQFGRVEMVGALVGVSVTREMGPLMTAIIVSGRVGAAFTAELGTMKVNDEILAAETMAIDPIQFLVVPRFLALIIVLPCLTTLSDISALVFALLTGASLFDVPQMTFMGVAQDWIQTSDILVGGLKSAVFGALIAHICCFEAFHLKGGASSVGTATMRAVVLSMVAVLAADAVFAYFTI